MQLLLAFSIFMTFVYLPWDVLIQPLGEDQEVWFGVRFYRLVCQTGRIAALAGLWRSKLRLSENETLDAVVCDLSAADCSGYAGLESA